MFDEHGELVLNEQRLNDCHYYAAGVLIGGWSSKILCIFKLLLWLRGLGVAHIHSAMVYEIFRVCHLMSNFYQIQIL